MSNDLFNEWLKTSRGFQPGDQIEPGDEARLRSEFLQESTGSITPNADNPLVNLPAGEPLNTPPPLPPTAGQDDFGLIPQAPGNPLTGMAQDPAVMPEDDEIALDSDEWATYLYNLELSSPGTARRAHFAATNADEAVANFTRSERNKYKRGADFDADLERYKRSNIIGLDMLEMVESRVKALQENRSTLKDPEQRIRFNEIAQANPQLTPDEVLSQTLSSGGGRGGSSFNQLKEAKGVLPDGDPAVRQLEQRASRQTQQGLALEIASNPQEQVDIAIAAQNALTGGDLDGQETFEVNLSKLRASQKIIRDNDDKQVGMLRGILGEAAGNSTNVSELVQSLTDDQARQFAAMKREAGIMDSRPGAVVIEPGVQTNEEIRRLLTTAAQSNALVLEINEGKKGMTATSAYLDAKSYNALMNRFKDPEPKSTPSKSSAETPDVNLDSPDVIEALEERIAALDPESEEAKTLQIKLNEYRKGKEAREFLATQVLPGLKEGLLKIVPPPREWARAGGALLRGAKAVR